MTIDSGAYFDRLEEQVDSAYTVAEAARSAGYDPAESVEIPVAKDMADRVQNLLGIPGVADRVRELEAEMSREAAALALAEDFAAGRVGTAEEPAGIIEEAVRTSVALLTEGVVAAPIEGIDGVDLLLNDDGSQYVRVYYAGPIRSAGGTAQALSVLVADYTRTLLDIDHYKPRENEIERYVEEVALYDADTGLQYSPSSAETRFIAAHCPICLDGEPTSSDEVSGYRDLERIETNRARGGLCLVLAEGIALKAPKIKRYTSQLDEVEWPWLDELIEGSLGDKADAGAGEETEDDSANSETKTVGGLSVPHPSDRYLTDLIAGRPVFSHPSRTGGFRLRYGRARNHGFATAGVHPATMHLLDDFLATGTQIKTERPGKAAGVIPVDTIEGPTVRLATGEVRRIDDPAEAREIRNGVAEIIDVGEYLVNVGEFIENNYSLAPASYVPDWWAQELEQAGVDVQALRDDPTIDLTHPTAEQAIAWAHSFDAPLHPSVTYCWHDIEPADVVELARAIDGAVIENGEVLLPSDESLRTILGHLLVEYVPVGEEIRIDSWKPLVASLGYEAVGGEISGDPPLSVASNASHGLAAVNELAPFDIRAKAPTRIGNRMGRPEKSEERSMSPAVHTLFPIGEAGGSQRDVADATKHADSMTDRPGEIEIDIGHRICPECHDETFRLQCPTCSVRTEQHFECRECETVLPNPAESRTCPRCESTVQPVSLQSVDVDGLYREALDRVGERETAFPILKGVKGLMSAEKMPEPMEKGILRAKHQVSAFKDGTVRYDMTDLPVTAVRPAELSVSVDHFRQLGYTTDIHGEELVHDDQLVELQVQDIVLSDGAAAHLVRTAQFVDNLLTDFYDMEPFYETDDREDLIGELVFGMAPHTSAAVVGRIVGFTSAAVGYAHPYFHAAKRRNCDGDEDCVMLLLDGLLNFSRSFLPSSRGGRMDAPLVMSSRVDPAEIDDEAHNMDTMSRYPREFYEATLRNADPDELDLTLAGDSIGTDSEYAGFHHTHDTSNIAMGPDLSAYKTLDSMMDKMEAQLELARKLRAVDETDVAERVIESHFLPDLLGNLRAFSRQETRCLSCGVKYRRMPLSRTCRECGGDVVLTVHEGSVKKYMETALRIAKQYGCREYTIQRLELLETSLESLFEDDENKQSGIADFM